LHPSSTETTEFEMKICAKAAKEAKAEQHSYFVLFLRSNKTHLAQEIN